VCYSAKVWRAYQEFVRRFGAVIDIHAFAALYAARDDGAKIKTTKAMDDAFLHGGAHDTPEARNCPMASPNASPPGTRDRPPNSNNCCSANASASPMPNARYARAPRRKP